MRVASSNIRDNPDISRAKVREAAAATAKLGDVCFFQEIGEKEDHIDIAVAMGSGWTFWGNDVAIPIAWKPKQWSVVEQGTELMHHGRAGASPNRYINWVVLKRKLRFRARRARQKVVCFMNTHFVSGAWNDKKKSDKLWRQDMWELHWKQMRDKVLSFVVRGITVVFGGDWNRLQVPYFHERQQWIAQHGIDKLGYIRGVGGSEVRVLDRGSEDVTKVHDHRAIWARVWVRAA